MRIVVVGGGVLGTMHAWQAVERGHTVVHLERELEARGASVRNFGLVWVGGRAGGEELRTALRARELWERIGADVPGVGFRPAGSLTLCRNAEELAVAEAALTLPDAVERGLKLLTSTEARALNPALLGTFEAALWCERDGAVESRVALPALRAKLAASDRYTWLPGREVRDLLPDGTGVRDDHGDRHDGDLVVLCPGANLTGLVRELEPAAPVRRVRLQMMQTDPLDEPLTTAVADGDSFRYYPAYAGPELDALTAAHPQAAVPAAHKMQLLMVQRLDGSLTIGDTHEYAEPFAFDVVSEPYDHLVEVAERLLGRPLPPIRRRWAGVYAQTTADGDAIVHRNEVAPATWLVTGPGGRGMTCSPAIAELTAERAGF
ncbi:TIGR03364 family FAD-dependent oxidoreductase [Yinghuangia seranimata]|uniref:TIGR03364 family FAD-dependent oxidoreductase n=1 Tax=Yinghuangia seranimata TaxID=408067 RepID=UPI00248B9130|nr:TIGR03364 family FAD-dependent oxidoreductase [Yinghuangia seranimata]MDI2131954.1 TIGR03364 family FAD-dependent oxidoreductase [Yinghuangia seranimata]